MLDQISPFSSVYGPVSSWRLGLSLGIDPIGPQSTCSFRCVYCQLGEIEHLSTVRQIFVSTQTIEQDLQPFAPWNVDSVTLSGSGEPTLALNLGSILVMAKKLTGKPVTVLTNGSLLENPEVCADLAIADQVAVKLDAVLPDPFRRINRPATGVRLQQIWSGLEQFRRQYSGHLAIQTMLLSEWNEQQQAEYIVMMEKLQPDEIQLNTPTRPKPIRHEIEARGNHTVGSRPYPVYPLKQVSTKVLQRFCDRIHCTTGIPTRYPHQ